MIVDCFTFFNELELLEIRLEELKDVVDWFVLVEARETYTGQAKELTFEANRHRFRGYNICHVKIEQFPNGCTSAWHREHFSRDAIAHGLQGLNLGPRDIVMVSDVDEIPRAALVRECGQWMAFHDGAPPLIFEQALYYYYVNCSTESWWAGTRMVRYGDLGSPQALRASDGQTIPRAGWHFSYLGGTERIREKIDAYAHTELNRPEYTDPAHLERCLNEARDLFGREMALRFVPIDATYPRYLRENPEQFAHLIRQEYATPSAEYLFRQAVETPSDINEHLSFLYRLASTVAHVTEFGTRSGQSTTAFIHAKPQRLICYDRECHETLPLLTVAAQQEGVAFTFHEADVLTVEIEATDLLFIDTWHVEPQMRAELDRHADKVRRYLVMHDTETFGERGESAGYAGIWPAIAAFIQRHPEWRLWQHFAHNNGLTVLTRL